MRRIDELFTVWAFLGSRRIAWMLGADRSGHSRGSTNTGELPSCEDKRGVRSFAQQQNSGIGMQATRGELPKRTNFQMRAQRQKRTHRQQ
jgi:hypothetical protein